MGLSIPSGRQKQLVGNSNVKVKKKNIYILFVLAIAGLLIASISFWLDNDVQQFNRKLDEFSTQLKKEQKLVVEECILLSKNLSSNNYEEIFQNNSAHFKSLFKQHQLSLFVVQDSSLKLWSTNSEPTENIITQQDGFFQNAAGFYEKYTLDAGKGKKIIALLLIKKEHRYENSYITPYFANNYNIDHQWKVEISKGKTEIKSLAGNYLQLKNNTNLNEYQNDNFLFVIEFISLLVLLLAIYLYFKQSVLNPVLKSLTLAIVLFALRAGMLWLSFPFHWYNHSMMNPEFFAYSNWLPSLGDFFIHSIFILVFVQFIFSQKFNLPKEKNLSKTRTYLFSFCFCFLFLFASWNVAEQIELLVFNSNVQLDIKQIFTLDGYSFLAFLCIIILLYSYTQLLTWGVKILKELNIEWKNIVTTLVAICTVFFVLLMNSDKEDVYSLVLSVPLIAVIIYRVYKNHSSFELNSTIGLLLLLSLFTSVTIEKYIDVKEKDKRTQKALLMATERDPIAEYLFANIQEKLNADTLLKLENDTLKLEQYIHNTCFEKYWAKYDIHITTDSLMNSMEMIRKNLFHSENIQGASAYFGILQSTGKQNVFVLMIPKNISDDLGYPLLLVNKQTENNTLDRAYSIAKYINNKLVYQQGNYSYPEIFNSLSDTLHNEFQWKEFNDYNHLFHKRNNGSILILSKESGGIWHYFSSYSFLFLLFSFIALCIYAVSYIRAKNTAQASFKSRLQFSMLTLLFFSGTLIGISSVYFINKQYDKKNADNIIEKIKSVNLEVERRLSRKKAYDNPEFIRETLDRFSKVFFTDINLYDTKGKIIASSRNELFSEGLLSTNINPQAFVEMRFNNKTVYTQTENIESLEYLSAYYPFHKDSGELVGYLNLPYFSHHDELSNEISSFMIALINIYGILVIFSLLTALLVSSYITRPLSFIQQKLKSISIGKHNEIIEWKSNDEIGNLVNEYNRKVLELTESAEKLAKSEREGAWREMAKQVAHEIKNPLTPMKLNVQYLTRLYNDISKEEFEERLTKISKSLIDQIDTLSNIATEFSNFARMPDPILETVDMLNIIENCQQLYSDKEEVNIYVENNAINTLIKGDKDQMLRVFNNLVKNAIQAIPEGRTGKISLQLKNINDKILVEIQDNGKGISEEDKDRIFIPNFTTKNSGMGLGLAMVKKMIEGIDGKIWFESTENIGTTFFVELPNNNDQ